MKFKRIKFKIKCYDPFFNETEREAIGWDFGLDNFALNRPWRIRFLKKNWYVTHLPTGLTFASKCEFKKREYAIDFAIRLRNYLVKKHKADMSKSEASYYRKLKTGKYVRRLESEFIRQKKAIPRIEFEHISKI